MCAVLEIILEVSGLQGLAIWRGLHRGQERFSIKGQMLNVLSFVAMWSLSHTLLCYFFSQYLNTDFSLRDVSCPAR